MDGRKATADCGHEGTVVIGTFVECDRRCARYVGKSDGTPLHVDPEKTKPYCLACGSDDLRFWYISHYTGHPLYRCNKCNGMVST